MLLAAWACASAPAHDFTFTDTVVLIKPDHTFILDLTCDLDELLLGNSPGQPSNVVAERVQALPEAEREEAVERLREFFRRRIRVDVDDRRLELSVDFPEYGDALARNAPLPTVLGTTARLSGRIPSDGRALVIRVSAAFPPVRLAIFKHDYDRPQREVLAKGVESSPFPLDREPDAPVAPHVAWQFLLLGFLHILPEGLDHILFVLGLYLLSARVRPLLWQVTAFTVAHTATLALAMLGIFSLPASVVEPLIALSIAYVAIENTLTRDLKPWRPIVVFLFGLLHGMGFAGVLTDLDPPRSEFVVALLGFNLGVELGQLAVIGLAFLLSGWWRAAPWYRRRVVIPASVLIAAVSIYWTIDRSFGS